jgi:uncharacterized membrane protein
MMFYTALLVILFFVLVLIFVAVSETTFQAIGFTREEFTLILLATLFGSFVNIPVHKSTRTKRVVDVDEVRAFWVTYRIPHVGLKDVSTVLAVNLGEQVIPILVSAYLILSHVALVPEILLSVVHLVARKVEGVGSLLPHLSLP